MLVMETHQQGGTWVFYVLAPVILGGTVACLWWIARGAIALFGNASRSARAEMVSVSRRVASGFCLPGVQPSSSAVPRTTRCRAGPNGGAAPEIP